MTILYWSRTKSKPSINVHRKEDDKVIAQIYPDRSTEVFDRLSYDEKVKIDNLSRLTNSPVGRKEFFL